MQHDERSCSVDAVMGERTNNNTEREILHIHQKSKF